jgi:hypothetical protein
VLIHDGEVYQDVIISQAECDEEGEEGTNHQDIVVSKKFCTINSINHTDSQAQ